MKEIDSLILEKCAIISVIFMCKSTKYRSSEVKELY